MESSNMTEKNCTRRGCLETLVYPFSIITALSLILLPLRESCREEREVIDLDDKRRFSLYKGKFYYLNSIIFRFDGSRDSNKGPTTVISLCGLSNDELEFYELRRGEQLDLFGVKYEILENKRDFISLRKHPEGGK